MEIDISQLLDRYGGLGVLFGFFLVAGVGPRLCGGGLGFWGMVFDFLRRGWGEGEGFGRFLVIEEVLVCLFLLYACFSFDCAPTVRWPSRGLGC